MNAYIKFLVFYREYKLILPRKEVEEVDNLRDEWVKLIELAEKVRQTCVCILRFCICYNMDNILFFSWLQVRTELLIKKRGMFEQELDKEVKVRYIYNICK